MIRVVYLAMVVNAVLVIAETGKTEALLVKKTGATAASAVHVTIKPTPVGLPLVVRMVMKPVMV